MADMMLFRPAKFFRPLRHHKIKINNIRWLSY